MNEQSKHVKKKFVIFPKKYSLLESFYGIEWNLKSN